MRKLLLTSTVLFGLIRGAEAQQPGCTHLSLTVGCYVWPEAILQVPQILPNGAVGAPALAWVNAPTTGIWWSASDGGLHFGIAGTEVGKITSTGLNSMVIGATTPAAATVTVETVTSKTILANWTTGTRPSSPVAGTTGYNSSVGAIEWWNGSAWVQAAGAGGTITLTGAVTGSGSGTVATTFKSIAAGHVIGNGTGSTAAADDSTLTSVMDQAFSAVRGGIVYRNGTVWGALAAGTTGNVLQTNGTTADPAWVSISGILDGLGGTQGSILYRNASAWVTLAPGSAGQELVSPGAAANLSWSTLKKTWTITWPSTLTVTTGTTPMQVNTQPTTLVIDSVSVKTGGSSTPSAVVAIANNGTTLTGCGTISVGTTLTTTSCTAANTISAGGSVDVIVVSVSGSPAQMAVQANWHLVTP